MYFSAQEPWPVQFRVRSLQEEREGKQAGRMPGKGEEARVLGEVWD